MAYFFSCATAASAALKPTLLWVPSQKGFVTEPPQRHSAMRGPRPVVSLFLRPLCRAQRGVPDVTGPRRLGAGRRAGGRARRAGAAACRSGPARAPRPARLPRARARRAARAEEVRAPRPRGRVAPRRLRGGQPRLQARLPPLPDPARLRPALLRRSA